MPESKARAARRSGRQCAWRVQQVLLSLGITHQERKRDGRGKHWLKASQCPCHVLGSCSPPAAKSELPHTRGSHRFFTGCSRASAKMSPSPLPTRRGRVSPRLGPDARKHLKMAPRRSRSVESGPATVVFFFDSASVYNSRTITP